MAAQQNLPYPPNYYPCLNNAPIDEKAIIASTHIALTQGTTAFSRFRYSYRQVLANFGGTTPKTCLCMTPCKFECFIMQWIDDLADTEFEILTTRLARVCHDRMSKSFKRAPRRMEWAPLGMGDCMARPKFSCEAYFGFMNYLELLDDRTLGILCREHMAQRDLRCDVKGKRLIRKRDEGLGLNVPIRDRVRQNRDGETVWCGATSGRWGVILLY